MLKVKNKYLYIIIVGLLFLYIFSFIFQRSDKRKSLKSTLINPSYVNEIEYLINTYNLDMLYIKDIYQYKYFL